MLQPESSPRARVPVDVRLNAIVDPAALGATPPAEAALEAVRGGATLLQYRDKSGSTRAMVSAVRAILAAVRGTGVPVLVNDRLDVALAAGADGIHVGQDDLPAADARRLLGPEAIIGLSITDAAEADGAGDPAVDYVGLGPVFATGSKADAADALGLGGTEAVARLIRAAAPGLPIVAIGGLGLANAADVIGAGTDGIAVISAILGAPDRRAAAAELRRAVDRALAETGR
ncbi:thiamine phosphate synthase [Segnochrobactrum spirostomi]|uniref:Thiamine-phosphate synthase n=1 Tax=Segnochrobactrum spirostomi TaxID=2608987 RepID=A0A6A7XZD0_9HYPH|nr:thiamine phosphate synthase [Segnochrobactrum spirostomi]MQT11109.1 thiamine phosphate synthase [Segnochrobactrum spirostomi]